MKFDATSYEMGRQAGGGGGGSAVIESITITQNGTTTAPSGVDGYSPIVVNVPAPTPTYEQLNITQNGTYTPSSGYDAISEVVVAVPISLQNKTITTNGSFTADSGYDGLGKVSVNVSGAAPLYNITGNLNGVFSESARAPWFEANYTNLGTITGINTAREAFLSSTQDIGNKTIALTTTGDGADCRRMFWNATLSSLPIITGKIGNGEEMFMFSHIQTIDLSGTTYDQNQNSEGTFSSELSLFKQANATSITLPSSMSFHSAAFMFGGCTNLESIDDTNCVFSQKTPQGWNPGGTQHQLFWACYNLRELPMNLVNAVAAFNFENYGNWTMFYHNMCQACRALDEIVNLPVIDANSGANMTDMFDAMLDDCHHLSRFTFAAHNGTVNWQGAGINLRNNGIGYGGGHNLPAAKEITDAASYAALKNDPDAWTQMKEYSRYNHDSAAETLASLPQLTIQDVCVIAFDPDNGSLTDAGAISTLTSAEIAVATSNGWTVGFGSN